MKSTPKEFVAEFQRRVGLDDDEDPGEDTYNALDRVLPKKPKAEQPAPVVIPASQAGVINKQSPAEKLAACIIAEAKRFCGLQEVRPNQNWDNPATKGPDTALVAELIAGMRQSPWEPGWAYCAAFAESMAAKGLEQFGATPAQIAKFRSVMSPHCMTSAAAFARLNLLSSVPVSGAIWLAQHGSSDNGHAGICTLPHAPNMDTIEANTGGNGSGSQREGDWITHKIRPIAGPGDLHTRGFVHPVAILKICGL
jgi:hypothetical protein